MAKKELEPSQRGSISRLDEHMLRAAENNWSPEKISTTYDVTPQYAANRIKYLLSTQDYLSDYERKRLLLNSAMKFKEKLDQYTDDFALDPKMANVYLKMIDTLSRLLKEQGEISDRERKEINEVQSRAIVKAVEKGFYSIMGILREKHPEVDLNELNAAFRMAVQEGLLNDSQ